MFLAGSRLQLDNRNDCQKYGYVEIINLLVRGNVLLQKGAEVMCTTTVFYKNCLGSIITVLYYISDILYVYVTFSCKSGTVLCGLGRSTSSKL
jgi:hypothetical protein